MSGQTRRRFATLALLFALALVPFARASAVEPAAAQAFVSDLAERATEVLNAALSNAERSEQLRVILKEGFDVEFIARTVLGPPYRDLTEAQRAAYVGAFEEWVVATYASQLDNYTGQTLAILGSAPQGQRDARVSTRVEGTQEPVRIDWRVREREGRLQIIDIEVEGVSMAVSQRSEFGAVVQRQGIDGLIALLQQRAGIAS
jgi:phospholipid transport system substrate-binding protein